MRSALSELRSAVDIALVSFIIYRILVLLVGTRAVQLVKGVLILIAASAIASWLRLRLLSWFIGNALLALSFAVPIVFQPELRKMLEELGKGQFYLLKPKMSDDEADVRAKQVSGALSYLKAHKIGALLVFQREVGLADYYDTAIRLNSNITQELIISIFWKDNPLHDGAVILDRNRLIAGGCYLPLADAPEISRWYGTRHRAALGITELSDALVLIVSEERGDVSLANKGRLSKNLKDFQVEKLLRNYFMDLTGEQSVSGIRGKLKEAARLFWDVQKRGFSETGERKHENA
ncbi:MAG: diadenylate cyclase CdaA [Synergistaceae bacterium]|nr:diadenylate cyclase CdaA [Synergistaceae bacterium]